MHLTKNFLAASHTVNESELPLFVKDSGKLQSVLRAGMDALAASDAFRTVRCMGWIDAHFAHGGTGAALRALVIVLAHLQNGDLVKGGIDSAQGTQIFAERAVEQYTAQYNET